MEFDFFSDFTLSAMQRQVLTRIVLALVFAVVLLILVRFGKHLVQKYISDPARRYQFSKLVGRVGGVLSLVLIIGVFSIGGDDLLTLLTVVGAGLAIAMRETLLSIVGWVYILFRTPFKHSDRVQIGEVAGDVIDIRLFHTTLMEIRGWVEADQSTGRIVHIPNNRVLQQPIYNYSRGFSFVWNELSVAVTFRSDWQAAREIMLGLAEQSAAVVEQQAARQIRQMSREYLIHYSILTPFVYVRIVDNGIRLTLRYLCEVRKRRGTEHALTISMLDAFKEHGGVELAYPMFGITSMNTPQFGPPPSSEQRAEGDGATSREQPSP